MRKDGVTEGGIHIAKSLWMVKATPVSIKQMWASRMNSQFSGSNASLRGNPLTYSPVILHLHHQGSSWIPTENLMRFLGQSSVWHEPLIRQQSSLKMCHSQARIGHNGHFLINDGLRGSHIDFRVQVNPVGNWKTHWLYCAWIIHIVSADSNLLAISSLRWNWKEFLYCCYCCFFSLFFKKWINSYGFTPEQWGTSTVFPLSF